MKTIDAREFVGTGFPPEEGKKLAEALMSMDDFLWEEDAIDVRDCTASLLISAFFNSFLQTVYEERPELLKSARKVHWKVEHPFQKKNVGKWMREFKPYAVA